MIFQSKGTSVRDSAADWQGALTLTERRKGPGAEVNSWLKLWMVSVLLEPQSFPEPGHSSHSQGPTPSAGNTISESSLDKRGDGGERTASAQQLPFTLASTLSGGRAKMAEDLFLP